MADESYRTATVQGKEVPYDPEAVTQDQRAPPATLTKHAMPSGGATSPSPPKCNIQCNYCIRDFDCVNESRPGVTSKVLSPEESLDPGQEGH